MFQNASKAKNSDHEKNHYKIRNEYRWEVTETHRRASKPSARKSRKAVKQSE